MMARADFWFALAVTALGLGAVIEALRMPRLSELGVHPMSAPGLTPGLLGLVLAALGLALLLRSLRAPGAGATAADAAMPRGWGRLAAALTLCLAYAGILLGRTPFWLATALFVFAFVLAFSGRRPRDLAVAAALALAVAAGVTLLFERVFLVRLP